MGNHKNFIQVQPSGLFWKQYVFIDTKNGLSQTIFAEKGIRVKICREYEKSGEDFRFVICKVMAGQEDRFQECMEVLASRAAWDGEPYEEYSARMHQILGRTRG